LDRRYPETNNQLSTIDKKVSKEIEANKNVMGRASEIMALANMTSKQRKKYAYGVNAKVYFSHLEITTELLKKVKPKKDE
jgi:hypothetical protein